MQVMAGSIHFPLDLPSACERISPSRLRPPRLPYPARFLLSELDTTRLYPIVYHLESKLHTDSFPLVLAHEWGNVAPGPAVDCGIT